MRITRGLVHRAGLPFRRHSRRLRPSVAHERADGGHDHGPRALQVRDTPDPFVSSVRAALSGRTQKLERLAVELYARALLVRDAFALTPGILPNCWLPSAVPRRRTRALERRRGPKTPFLSASDGACNGIRRRTQGPHSPNSEPNSRDNRRSRCANRSPRSSRTLRSPSCSCQFGLVSFSPVFSNSL